MGLSVSTAAYTSPLYVSGNPADQALTSGGGDGSGSYTVGNSVGNGVPNLNSLPNLFTAFSDVWNFTLADSADLWTSVVANNSVIPARYPSPAKSINIADGSLGFQLEKQVDATNIWNNVPGFFDTSSSASYDFLVSGNYRFLVTGTVNGTSGKGSYGFNVNVYDPISLLNASPTTVPTPQTWALLLVGGTILIGFQMRRNSLTQDSMLLAA
jgi:hypothetical protein